MCASATSATGPVNAAGHASQNRHRQSSWRSGLKCDFVLFEVRVLNISVVTIGFILMVKRHAAFALPLPNLGPLFRRIASRC